MSEIKWIKITTNMFEDEKIDFIESLPEADAILVIWSKLLCLAGKCNSNGFIMLTENIPYDEKMLAHKFKRNPNIVSMALDVFVRLEMLTLTDNGFCITNFAKHQNIDGLDKIKEQTRQRVAKHREALRLNESKQDKSPSENVVTSNELVTASNVTCNVTVTQCNDTERDIDLERDKDLKEILIGDCQNFSSQSEPEKNNSRIAKKEIDDCFEKLWALYPNKQGKGKVKFTQKQKLYDVGFDKLKLCIDRYKSSKQQWREWQHGSTFFTSGYIDFLDANYKGPPPVTASGRGGAKEFEQFDARHYDDELFEQFYANTT